MNRKTKRGVSTRQTASRSTGGNGSGDPPTTRALRRKNTEVSITIVLKVS